MTNKGKIYTTAIILIALCLAGSAIYYFSYFLPKQYKAKQQVKAVQEHNDYLFSMKQKCTDVANKAYNVENEKSKDVDYVKLWRYAYNQKLNTCIYEISNQSKVGNIFSSYSIAVTDGLSGQVLASYFRMEGENPPFDDYKKKSDEFFNQ